uniref:MyTH4 domain-containing protein n=1 Tax=Angiostrongylus cantonensis TaxID=6313 RepID=A0A0K0D3P3_ANGCA
MWYVKGHLLEPRREPILTPFLHKGSDTDFRLSLEIFKAVLKYMNDQTLSREQLDDLGRYIVKQGIENPCQRDEIFVQLCNQIHRNPDKEAQSRCCRLLLHAVGTFAPTKVVLPMLISFCNQQRSSLQTQLLNTIARRMTISNYEIARLLPASVLEMSAIYNLRNPAVEVTSQDGQTHVVEAHSWITSEKLVNTVLQHRGIGNPNGWSVEVEAKKMVYHPTGAHFLHDVISEIELGKEENKKLVESFFFNYPNEKTLPPMNAKKTDLQIGHTQCKMSPVVKRHMRQLCNESREMSRSLDVMNTSRGVPHRERSLDWQATTITLPQLYGRVNHEIEDEHEPKSCYALPMKQNLLNGMNYFNISLISFISLVKIILSLTQVQYLVHNTVPIRIYLMEVDALNTYHLDHLDRQQRATWHNDMQDGTSERLDVDQPSQYYATSIPMVQYVPVMVTPQPAVLTTHMNQKIQTTMHPSLPVPATNFYHGAHCRPYMTTRGNIEQRAQKQLSASHSNYLDEYSRNHSKSSSEERTHDVNAIKSVSQPKFDSLRSGSSAATQGGGCDSRILNSRCDYVPSVHSTMSVASQIRNMPVPNSNRDLDRFLDEVFDQVLSPHDLAAEMNAHEIASSVKGGAYGSTSCISPQCQEGVPFHQRGYHGSAYYHTGVEAKQDGYSGRETMVKRTFE